MAKAKKRGLSDKVTKSKSRQGGGTNPFEVKLNRQKHHVLGRKIAKHDKGKPGVSRSKAINKRKETLLVEYQKRGKTNKLIDRRIGEVNSDLSAEDKMLQRFTLERKKHHEKAEMFKLNDDDEDLTHYGQTLSEIERFEEPNVSGSEDDEAGGQIGAQMVGEEHFGGFLTRKTEVTADGKPKSWKERMEEIITQSKKLKYERQHEKEQTQEMTEKLDQEWKDIRLSMGISKRSKDTPEEYKKADDYDIAVRELQFEMKAKATDRLKTEEEIATEEKERLDNAEADRLRRMKGITDEDETRTSKHHSVDDLDDGFQLEADMPKERFHLSYKDGVMLSADDDKDAAGENEAGSSDESEMGTDDHGDDDDDDDDSDDDDECDDAMERTSDLESDEEEQEEMEEKNTKKKVSFNSTVEELKKKPLDPEQFKVMLLKKKVVMEEARKELPYTFEAPASLGQLCALLCGHSDADQLTVIDRLRKCHHPSLAEGNKQKMEELFDHLTHYYGMLGLQEPPALRLMDRLVKPLYELVQLSPLAAGQSMLGVVRSMQHEFNIHCEQHKGRGQTPTLDVLMTLKLVSLLFPTSDYKHPIVTPTLLFMSQLLTQCSVTSPLDVATGLFVCTLFLEYVSLSKRYVPEVVNFLSGVLFLASKKDSKTEVTVIAPFRPVGKTVDLLELAGGSCRNTTVGPVKLTTLFSNRAESLKYTKSDDFKVCCVWHSLKLLQRLSVLYAELPARAEIFAPIRQRCETLPIDKYPESVKSLQKQLLERIAAMSNVARRPLVMEKEKAQPLKMFEPEILDSFDGKKKRGGTKDFNEKQRMVHKYKQEFKGAVREIRKDNEFLARIKIKEQMERDEERKTKVKRLYSMLSEQEGDYKALKRTKNKM